MDKHEDTLDFTQLQNVLSEISEETDGPLESGWGDLSDVLTAIKNDCDLTLKLREILIWIVEHPDHTFPKHIHGWRNTLTTQFCSPSNAREILDTMIRLDILQVLNPKTFQPVRCTKLNRKRCRKITAENDERKKSRVDMDTDTEEDE